MRCPIQFSLSLSLVLAAFVAPHLSAADRPSGTLVAVIDIQQVFEKHPKFKDRLDKMMKDAKTLDGGFMERKQELNKLKQTMLAEPTGSPKYKEIEERLAKQISELNVDQELKAKEFQEREARIYYDTYMEVLQVVQEFSAQKAISLVLRFDRDEPDSGKRADVSRCINQPVVFQRSLDITDLVLDQLDKKMPTKSTATAKPDGPTKVGERSGAEKKKR